MNLQQLRELAEKIGDIAVEAQGQDYSDLHAAKHAMLGLIERVAELETQNEKLEQVAKIAAVCVIDLNHNLRDAEKEWMSGQIARGAFEYVLARHTNLHVALAEVGYTEKHKIFSFLVRPEKTGGAA